MTLEEACLKIEKSLMDLEEDKLISLFNKMFPEESLGLINSNIDFKEEVVELIIENIELNTFSLSKLYKKLFNEKIVLEEDSQKEQEEQEQWQ